MTLLFQRIIRKVNKKVRSEREKRKRGDPFRVCRIFIKYLSNRESRNFDRYISLKLHSKIYPLHIAGLAFYTYCY